MTTQNPLVAVKAPPYDRVRYPEGIAKGIVAHVTPGARLEQAFLLLGIVTQSLTNPNARDVLINDFLEVPNTHPHPEANYRVLTKDVPNWESIKPQMVGVLHTHPKGSQRGPSYYDVSNIGNALGMVLHVTSLKMTIFDASGFIDSTSWRRYRTRGSR